MKEQGIVSKYTIAQYKSQKAKCNESEIGNVLNREFEREFEQDEALKVVVSDLTYVRVDLYNREIIDYSSGPNKTAALVQRAFTSVPYNLSELQLFHTDRGNEFKNQLIEAVLQTFGIERFLSEKGSPYDNAVAEAMFKTIKTEFINGTNFPDQQALDLALFDYVHWFNNIRIHESLDYLTPTEYKLMHSK